MSGAARQSGLAAPSRFEARELLGALPLSAIALLVLNDVFWKPAFHNPVTGKLSDLAGCFFFPLWLSALLGLLLPLTLRSRLWLGAAGTVALFVPLKTSPAAARAICAALGWIGRPFGFPSHQILADPTDLIALPLTFAAVAWALRREAHLAAPLAPRTTP